VTVLFNRSATVQVGTLVVRDLRMAFRVERSLRPVPNKATIEISNLREDHRSAIERADAGVVLSAGYVGSEALLFSGEVRKAASTYDEPNWTTKIEGQDGGQASRTARVNRSFRPGTPLRTVFETAAGALGLGLGNIAAILPGVSLSTGEQQFATGTALSGPASVELDRLCASCGLTWSVQNGAIQLVPLARALRGQAVKLSASTGLVGSPAKDARGVVKARAKLIPDLVPGRQVILEARAVSGVYRLDRATYIGDTHGSDWHIDCELSQTGGA
jgi:hypothetical protein